MNYPRYQRQFPIIGLDGQAKLKHASVCLIGCGGVGCPVALYLAAAGIGEITLIDNDIIEYSNLQRQVIFREKDVGQSKVSQAKKELSALNSEVTVNAMNTRLTVENARKLLAGYNLVIDGSDNFKTRYLVNDVCCHLHVPFISASVLQTQAQLFFSDTQTGCYRCIFPEVADQIAVPNCSESGVIGSVVGVIATIAATMAIQYLVGETVESNKLHVFNSETFSLKPYVFRQQKNCPACVHKKIQPVQTSFSVNHNYDIEVDCLDDYYVIDVRSNWEREICQLPDNQHIPLSLLSKSKIPIQTEKPILFYCKSGYRSNLAVHYYRQSMNTCYAFSLGGGLIRYFTNQTFKVPY